MAISSAKKYWSQNVVVPVIGDTAVEGNESFTVMLTGPSNATLGAATATGTILDDDVAPAVPVISIASVSAVEGNSGSAPMTFVVTLDVPTVATVMVNYATSNGSALAASDYANTAGTLTFSPGVTSQVATRSSSNGRRTLRGRGARFLGEPIRPRKTMSSAFPGTTRSKHSASWDAFAQMFAFAVKGALCRP